jgi:hypothetical protein
MKIIKKLKLPALWLGFLVTFAGCLPGPYYGDENGFGGRWEPVAAEEAPAETLFSRFYELKQMPHEDRLAEYEKVLQNLEQEHCVFWHLEAIYLSVLTGHTQKGNALLAQLEEMVDQPGFKNDHELQGVIGLLELMLKQKCEIIFTQNLLEKEKKKSTHLAHQLKELKNIEKIIHERETNKEHE